ncbi:recQ-mediated genome instability protein 1-like [Hetaerina americana]|uniref:recQ-mediated genome instability protein 1-like n=1 Tax=Hetaerina americana TaxID=62018 RepID=UPI003A7F48D2
MSEDVNRVTHYLKSQSLHASQPWIAGCVEYYKSEHPGRQVSIFDIQNFAFEQWLLVDLRTMGIGSLPPSLSLQKELILNGKYAVQVEYVINIGAPAYSQLLIERRVSTENCDATVKKPESWEPKAGRVLKLSIFDGVQELVAMEYSPIRELNNNLIPGTKILIIGPVRCRRGIIMLEQRNVKVLGGEVDTLLIVNNMENVLSRALNRPENHNPPPNPEPASRATSVREPMRSALPAAPLHQRNEGQPASAVPSHCDFPDDDEMNDIMAAETHHQNEEMHQNNQGGDDDLLGDDDDDDLLLQLPDEQLSSQVLSNNTQGMQQVSRAASSVPAEPPDQVMIKWPLHSSHQAVTSEPFVYLTQLVNSHHRSGTYAVKGFLFTLLSTLQEKEGRWHLLAKLSDGTANMDVSFSEEVLDELIGFSATEMKALRQKMAGNPGIKEKLKQGFQEAKRKLHDMNCIFFLQFSPENELPVVSNIKDLSTQHLTSIRSRAFD